MSAMKVGLNPWVALLVAGLAGAFLGMLMEKLLMRPLYDGYQSWSIVKDEYAVVVTFAQQKDRPALQK